MYIDNKKKYILVFGKGPTQELNDTTITADAKYSIEYSRSQNKFCLSRLYNGSNNFLFVNATKMYQFKARTSDIKPYPFFLGNISKGFKANNMKKSRIK